MSDYSVLTLGRAVKQLVAEMSEDGIDPLSIVGERTFSAWLSQPIPDKCQCGAPMKRWEGLNKKCNGCRVRSLRREQERENAQ